MTKGRLARIILALDYLANTLLLGWHDEWISTRAWRLRNKHRFWSGMRKLIDGIARMFGQKNHCFWSYVSDQMHRAVPPELR